jgi:hypothetical protein
MFQAHPSLSTHFEPPVFSPGVPSREIRNRLRLLQYSRRAGLIPDVEWEGILRGVREQTSTAFPDELIDGIEWLDINADISCVEQNQYEVIDPFMHLAVTVQIDDDEGKDQIDSKTTIKKKRWSQTRTTSLVPISPDRKGSAEDITVPYSLELWRKAKTLSRDRSVFACTLAHLMAMKKLVGDECTEDQKFDFILEDNVRAFVGVDYETNDSNASANDDNDVTNIWTGWSCECSNRIWDMIELSEEMGKGNATNFHNLSTCHLRYFGWLGSLPNLKWVYEKHIPRKGHGTDDMTLFPFPTNDDFELDSIPTDRESAKLEKKLQINRQQQSPVSTPQFTTPGGTAVFGTFAYSISTLAYHSLINSLQNDVGALMWKSKKMRAYQAKPIDKILPRYVRSAFGEKCVHLPNKVGFLRCPMLGSLLHPQWELGFCESSELQYSLSSSSDCVKEFVWDRVWLTDEERHRVEKRTNDK